MIELRARTAAPYPSLHRPDSGPTGPAPAWCGIYARLRQQREHGEGSPAPPNYTALQPRRTAPLLLGSQSKPFTSPSRRWQPAAPARPDRRRTPSLPAFLTAIMDRPPSLLPVPNAPRADAKNSKSMKNGSQIGICEACDSTRYYIPGYTWRGGTRMAARASWPGRVGRGRHVGGARGARGAEEAAGKGEVPRPR